MKTELAYATTFLTDTIKAKLPDISSTKLQALSRQLTKMLQVKYENHWYTDTPLKGSAFRCINISSKERTTDCLFQQAAIESGISNDVWGSAFPAGLTLWVDHDDVSARVGNGSIFPIYKKITTHSKNKDDSLNSASKHRPQQRPHSISPHHTPVSRDAESVSSSPVPSPRQITRSLSTPVNPPPGFQPLHSGKSFDSIWYGNNGLSTICDNNILEHSFWNCTTNAVDTISHCNTMQYPLNYISPAQYDNISWGNYVQSSEGNNGSLQYLWKDGGTFQHGNHSSRTPSAKYSRSS